MLIFWPFVRILLNVSWAIVWISSFVTSNRISVKFFRTESIYTQAMKDTNIKEKKPKKKRERDKYVHKTDLN